MQGGFPIDLILFAMVAAFLVLRLRSVLGKRQGFERPPQPQGVPLPDGRAARAEGVTEEIIPARTGGARRVVPPSAGQALGRIGLPRLDILRPGLLCGPRDELRPAELAASVISPVADLLLHGKYAKYRSIKGETMARAIVGLTREKAAGRFVFEHEAILRAARKAD